jgi:hypothetical protein
MLPGMIDKRLQDEQEMRAFYESVGVSPEVIERAIAAKFKRPTPDARETGPHKQKKKVRPIE